MGSPTEFYYITQIIFGPKFGNSSISMKEVTITSIILGFDLKNQLLRVVLVQVQ